MKKSLLKFFSIGLILMLTILIAGCVNNTTTNGTTTTQQTTTSSTTTSSTTTTVQVVAPQFTSVLVSTGDDVGQINISASINTVTTGTIYYAVTLASDATPTKDQIIAGVDYDSVTMAASGHADNTIDTVVTVTDGQNYNVSLVASNDGGETSVITRSVTAKASVPVDVKGTGTASDPFLVEDLSDLERVASGLDYSGLTWSKDANYKLMADIDLSTQYNATTGVSWTPIGNSTNKFQGVFDGNGFTISNLYINTADLTDQGLFGDTDPGSVIKNLTLNHVNIQAKAITGSLVGYSKSTISNVIVKDTNVTTTAERAGGLIGRIYDIGSISNVYVQGNVSGNVEIGGLVGFIDIASTTITYITISDVAFIGNVTSATDKAGGITSYLRGATIDRAFVEGTIVANDRVGGIAGFVQTRSGTPINPTITDSIVLAQILSKTDSTAGSIAGSVSITNTPLPVLSNNYSLDTNKVFFSGDTLSGDNGLAMTSANLNDTSWFTTNLSSWDFTNTWTFPTDATRPVLTNSGDDGLAISYGLPIMAFGSGDKGTDIKAININLSASSDTATVYYVIVANGEVAPTAAQIKSATDYGSVTVLKSGNGSSISKDILMGNADTLYDVYYYAEDGTSVTDVQTFTVTSNANYGCGGTGTASDPLLICTVNDLKAIGSQDSDDPQPGDFTSTASYKLANDIDLSTVYGVDLASWTPIATFGGTFDGNGHTINGLYINLPDTTNVGLFAQLTRTAVIENILFTNVNILGGNSTGTLAGYSKATVTNVSVSGGTVASNRYDDSRVGGLVGKFNEGSISKVWTDVTVKGGKYVGGIVGHADYPANDFASETIISDLVAYGDVYGNDSIGGVIGYSRITVIRAVAYGNIYLNTDSTLTTNKQIGGVIGFTQNRATTIPNLATADQLIAANGTIDCGNSNVNTIIGNVSISSYGSINLGTSLFELDSISVTTSSSSSVGGTQVTASNLADSTWFTTNLPSWDFTNTWSIVDGQLALQGFTH